MSSAIYVMRTPTLGILMLNEERIPVTIPANARVSLVGSSAAYTFVDVLWNDTPLLMFILDLERPAQRIAAT
jgi:hypothetical protein